MQKVNEHFHSFDELREYMNLSPKPRMKTRNKGRLDAQKKSFAGKCPVCKSPFKYIAGSNVLVCSNEECAGYPHKKKNGEIVYEPVMRFLDKRGTDIGMTLFDE